MLNQNIFLLAGKSIARDLIADVLYFPVWWYTAGLRYVVVNRIGSISQVADSLAVRLLLLNILRPMFGQYDRAGRIISFFMRLVILFSRSLYLLVYSILQLAFVVCWVALPALAAYRVIDVFAISYAGN